MEIKWIGAHPSNYDKGRFGKTINKIVMHWIVGSLESAGTTFAKDTRDASAHYGVGDSDVHQYVREEDTAWHASNRAVNRESIGIEHEGGWLLSDKVNRFKPTDKTHETSAKLVADICQRYNIPIDRQHIRIHKEYRNTQCPGSLDVNRVIEMARNYSVPPPPPSPPPSPEITDQTRIPQIVDEQGVPMEVQAIKSRLRDMRKDLEDAGTTLARRIKEETEKVRAEELRDCDRRVKKAITTAEKNRDDIWRPDLETAKQDLKDLKLEYEKLLLRQVKNFGAFTLFRLGLKKLFGRAGK